MCCVNEGEQKRKKVRGRVPACICLIYHSAAVLFSGSFEAHSLSHLVRGLPAVYVCTFMFVVCVYVCLFGAGGVPFESGGV